MMQIRTTTAWDVVSTPANDVVIVIAPGDRPRTVLCAADGIYIGTEGQPLLLERSTDVVPIVAGGRTVVVVEADEAIVRETLVPVRRDGRSFLVEDESGKRAA